MSTWKRKRLGIYYKTIFLWAQTITEDDILETELWHEFQGNKPPSRYDISFLAFSLLHPFYFFPLFLVSRMRITDCSSTKGVEKQIMALKKAIAGDLCRTHLLR